MNEYSCVSGCSGIGGLDAGFKAAGFTTVCYIENADFPNQILLERMQTGELDIAPIFTDFRRFDGRPWRGKVDCFFAGIPCQPHSTAGRRLGVSDERDLWPSARRIIGEMGPTVVVVENVAGLFSPATHQIIDPLSQPPQIRYLQGRFYSYGLHIVGELQAMGYFVCKRTLSAAEVGSPQYRLRTFIIGIKLGDAQHNGLNGFQITRSVGTIIEERGLQESQGSDSTSGCVLGDANEYGQCGSLPQADGRTEERFDAGQTSIALANLPKQRAWTVSEEQIRSEELDVDGCSETLGNTECVGSSQQRELEQSISPEAHCRGKTNWTYYGSRRQSQSGLGGNVDGISDWVDKPRWPAGRGAPQKEWEPPRVSKGGADRTHRLKALGNAVVPQVAYEIAQIVRQLIEGEA